MSAAATPAPVSSPALRKIAIVLVTLGEETGAEMLKRLPARDVSRITQEISKLGSVPTQEAESVLAEFYQLGMARRAVGCGGLEFTRKVLTRAFGKEEGAAMLEKLARQQDKALVNVEALEQIDHEQLARFISSEHPQTIALILSQMKPSQAAAVMSALPPEVAAEVSLRVAKLERITPEVVDQVAGNIGKKLSRLETMRHESYKGLRSLADLCNQMDPEMTERILNDVSEKDPELADTIKRLLFVFEDLLQIDKNGIREVVSRITDRKVLTLALKGTSEKLQQHILQTMSQSGAEMLREDMEVMGPVKIRDVEGAQQEVISIVRLLEREGVISTRSGGEQYVD
jgi:flagellar motor switch protein FliG